MYTILAIDDEEENLEMVEFALGKHYDIVPIKNASDAFKYLSNHTPDLILLDICMPGMTGIELFQSMKKNVSCKDIPVIFLTSANDVDTEEHCFELGAVDFISKPFEPKIVLRRVERILELTSRKDTTTIEEKTIEFVVNGMILHVYQKDIYCIEVFNNNCVVQTTSRDITVRETLERMQEKLDQRFVKAGRSFLLNVEFVKDFDGDSAILENGKMVKLPRRNKKDIMNEIWERKMLKQY